MSTEKSALLYNEAVRRLSAQETDLGQIRTRAGGLVSAIAIATSFLGGNLVRGQTALTCLSWLAIGFFAISLGTCLWVLAWRVTGWASGFSILTVKRDWIDKWADLELDEIQSSLATFIEQGVTSNEVRLRHRRLALVVSGVALAAELIVWIIDLATRGTP